MDQALRQTPLSRCSTAQVRRPVVPPTNQIPARLVPVPAIDPTTDAALDLCAFIDASPSPYHAVATAAGRLDAAGFTALDERAAWGAGAAGKHYIVRGGALVAWARDSDTDPATGWRIIGAHTDSPNLRVKPHADTGRAGARQLAVEVYGGPLLNSWLDRDLGLSGRVALQGEEVRLFARRSAGAARPPARDPPRSRDHHRGSRARTRSSISHRSGASAPSTKAASGGSWPASWAWPPTTCSLGM